MTIIGDFFKKHLEQDKEFTFHSAEVFQLVEQELVEDEDGGKEFEDETLYQAFVLYFSKGNGQKRCLCNFEGVFFDLDEAQVQAIIAKDIVTNDMMMAKAIDQVKLKEVIAGLQAMSLLSTDEKMWENGIGDHKKVDDAVYSKSFFGDKSVCKLGDSVLTLRHACLDHLSFDEEKGEYLYHFGEPLDIADAGIVEEQIDSGEYDAENIESCSVSFL